MEYTPSELMITCSARALAGERVVFVGVGLPNIACNLARRTVAPDLELVYESGVFGPFPSVTLRWSAVPLWSARWWICS